MKLTLLLALLMLGGCGKPKPAPTLRSVKVGTSPLITGSGSFYGPAHFSPPDTTIWMGTSPIISSTPKAPRVPHKKPQRKSEYIDLPTVQYDQEPLNGTTVWIYTNSLSSFIMMGVDGKDVLEIKRDGTVKFGEGVTPNDAAKDLARFLKQYMGCTPEDPK